MTMSARRSWYSSNNQSAYSEEGLRKFQPPEQMSLSETTTKCPPAKTPLNQHFSSREPSHKVSPRHNLPFQVNDRT